jgi:hypothetical protein
MAEGKVWQRAGRAKGEAPPAPAVALVGVVWKVRSQPVRCASAMGTWKRESRPKKATGTSRK